MFHRTFIHVIVLILLLCTLILSVSASIKAQTDGEPTPSAEGESETQAGPEAEPPGETPTGSMEGSASAPTDQTPATDAPLLPPVEATVGEPVVEPIETEPGSAPATDLPTLAPVEPTLVTPPVIPSLIPTEVPPSISLPFHDSLNSDRGWRASGTWVFVDNGNGEQGWYADTAVRLPESMLEFETAITLIGVDRPQLVLRQKGALASSDLVVVELKAQGTEHWSPVDQQIGSLVSPTWAARTVDLTAFYGQTVYLRFHILSLGGVPAGETSQGYWIDEVAIQQYTEPPTVAPIINTPVPQPAVPTAFAPPTSDPAQSGAIQSAPMSMSMQLFAAPAVVVQHGLTAEYYHNIDLTGFHSTRTDATVNFSWGNGSPDPGIGNDTFSARWTGQIIPLYTETYTFYTYSDDGVRLWVNGQQVINNWTDHSPREDSGTINLVAGQAYDIRLEYYENTGGAEIRLSWSSASQPKAIVPQNSLIASTGGTTNPPTPTNTALPTSVPPTQTPLPTAEVPLANGTGLRGEYFDNSNLTGYKLSRIDPMVDFNWRNGPPAPGMGNDTFSVRWTGMVVPRYSQTYTFYTRSDDGVRLWINGQQIINNWTDHSPTENSGTIALQAGQPYLLVLEYYDNTAGAEIRLSWSSPSQPKQVIPQSQLIAPGGTTNPPTPTNTATPTNVPPTNTATPTNVPPTNTPVPTQPPPSGNGTGLRGEYFDSKDLTFFKLARTDSTVDFNWGFGEPAPGVANDTFSVRWTGQVVPLYSQTYTFYTRSDDGVRLWVNGQLVINNWVDQASTEKSGTIALQSGQFYALVLEYYDNTGGAEIRLSWSSASQTKQIIPQSQLYPAGGSSNPPAPSNTPLPTNTPVPTSVPPTNTATPTNVPPTNTPVPTQPPPSGNGTGLRGEYFDNSNLTGFKLARTDGTVDFNWGFNEPAPGVANDTFSVRWTGQVVPLYSQTYTFYTLSDDGVRLWVNNQLVINNWIDQASTEKSGTIALQAGQFYALVLEYYDNTGGAEIRLSWSSPSQPKQIIPQSQLYPAGGSSNPPTPTNTPTPTSVPPTATPAPTQPVGGGLYGEYFNEPDFTGSKVVRTDATVNFDWGYNAPVAGIDGETFSARWTGQVVPLYSQTYTFYTESDDGVRLWVNNQLVIDNWTDHPPTENSGTIALQAGQAYPIRLEFYENLYGAVMRLFWSSPSQPKQVIPETQLIPAQGAPNDPPPVPTNPVVPTPTPVPVAGASERRVVGYLPCWSRNLGYTVNDIDFSVVTHIADFGGTTDANGNLVFPICYGAQLNQAFINAVHQGGAKIILVMGGAGTGNAFSAMASSTTARNRFVQNVANAVNTYGYDGVDIDWETPNNATDRDNMTQLVREMRTAIGPNRTLSLAISPWMLYGGQWTDVEAMHPYVDWFAVMTYDFHGTWSGHTGHNAPIYSPTNDTWYHGDPQPNTHDARMYYQSRGVPLSKLYLGIPFYGWRYEGANDLGRQLSNTGGGQMEYRDIALLVGNGWTRHWDSTAQVPYLRGSGFISYDDPESIQIKCDYVRSNNLGGVVIWALHQDIPGQRPLLNATRSCR